MVDTPIKSDKVDLKTLRNIVSEILENVECNGYFPSVDVSKTDFGQSFYIQNEKSKIRISDHSVSNFDRIINEVHFDIFNLDIESLKTYILKYFSNEYITLIGKNGEMTIDFKIKILKSEFKHWRTAKIWFKEVQTLPLKLDDIKNWEVIEYGDLTKKGDKRFCKVLRDKYSFGMKNIVTGHVERTRFPVLSETELEIIE